MDRALKWVPSWAALPPWGRWGFLAGAGLLLALLIGGSGWYWWEWQQEAGQTAFDQAFVLYRQAMVGGTPELYAQAVRSLEGVTHKYPRHPVTLLAYYTLGNLHYRAREYGRAVMSFEQAVRTGRGDLQGMSQLGLGYSWEGQGDPARASAVYQDALKQRDAKDPHYGEFLLGMARTHIAMKRPAEAKELYERFLRELPTAPQVEDVRTRLASLEGARTP